MQSSVQEVRSQLVYVALLLCCAILTYDAYTLVCHVSCPMRSVVIEPAWTGEAESGVSDSCGKEKQKRKRWKEDLEMMMMVPGISNTTTIREAR